MLSRIGDRIARVFRASAPDPFVLAVALTALTLVLALTIGRQADGSRWALSDVAAFWSADTGVWAFLKFAMQMCLILVTGHALAASPPMARAINALADIPRTGAQACALVAFVAATLGVLNWGLGLIAGALIARDVGRALHRRGVRAHYPVIAASGYVGLMVWHGGFSGTAPLKMTTMPDVIDVLKPALAEQVGVVPLTQTILSPLNLVTTGGLVAIACLVMAMLHPKRDNTGAALESFATFHPDPAPSTPSADDDKGALPRLLEDTPIASVFLIALIALWAWKYYFPAQSPSGITRLSPDTVNLTMLMLGLALHGTPARYVAAVNDAATGCAGIILQFPLYAGIMGMMNASGLTAQLATGIASASSQSTLPIYTFLSAGVINFFIPSGGGQWGVQGPIAMQSALDAGVAPAKMILAVAYGDQLTNMLQPFWALPLLAITGVRARDIVGYTAVLMAIAMLWIIACLLLF
ncbi:MAG: short-chain fatty acid transporter [Phycisphaeraceae bacterium]|nr:short-chain fatty acid transporter [Phycisphaeraceae bacterium]MCB9847100.1 short-chain fatty acid transporter [Phycisphaeraceae bacterium]